jgi:hypothetical protein
MAMSTPDITTEAFANTRPARAEDLPDYAPIPRPGIGPALNEQGYYVGRIERNLYWITDGTYQSAFLTTSEGVVLLDAPPTIGHNIVRAVNEIAAANGVSNVVTHLIYSIITLTTSAPPRCSAGASPGSGTRRRATCWCATTTRRGRFQRRRSRSRCSLEIGGERIELAWHGSNHSPDNIFIHLPDHDTLMLVDIVNPGWAPAYQSNLTEDIPGYVEAPATALTYPWKHFIGGHMGRLGARGDVALHQQYMADVAAASRTALDAVDPSPYFGKYGKNTWAAVRGYLDAVTAHAAAPVIEKYTGVLAGADVFTASTTFHVMQSIRLDLGYGSRSTLEPLRRDPRHHRVRPRACQLGQPLRELEA